MRSLPPKNAGRPLPVVNVLYIGKPSPALTPASHTCSEEEITNSLKEKIKPLPRDTIILPGHGDVTDLDYEMQRNIYLAWL